MRAAFYTLGCKVNQYEAEVLRKQFQSEGYQIVPPSQSAEVFVVCSCTVTSAGDKKTRQMLRQFRKKNPGAVIALTGCYPQAFPEEAAAVTEADIVLGARERSRLPEYVRQLLSDRERCENSRIVAILPHAAGEPFEDMKASAFADHTRAFVKIQDGCDRFCSYCIIPKARGFLRSKPLEELRTELRGLVENGYREIVLVGINLSSYGKESGWQTRLSDAVELTCATPGVARVRLGSLEPELLTDTDLDRLAAQEKLCPEFHLSLQSGCGETLRRMNRHYTPEEYAALVSRIRERFPGAALTTDIMVGFPGETESEFAESLAFAERIAFARMHIFAYSIRAGTRAASMEGQVSAAEKELRSRLMQKAADQMRLRYWESQVSTIQEVLFEKPKELGYANGHTRSYTPVRVPCTQNIRGEIFPVFIQSVNPEGCVGVFSGKVCRSEDGIPCPVLENSLE